MPRSSNSSETLPETLCRSADLRWKLEDAELKEAFKQLKELCKGDTNKVTLAILDRQYPDDIHVLSFFLTRHRTSLR